jgi:hypothetical protein
MQKGVAYANYTTVTRVRFRQRKSSSASCDVLYVERWRRCHIGLELNCVSAAREGKGGGSASCSPNWISSRCGCLSLAVWLPAQCGTNSMCQNIVPFPRIPWSRVILERLQYAQPVWNHKIQYRVRKSLSLPCVAVLNQMNPTHALQLCLPNIVVLWTHFLVRFPSFPIKIVYTFLISPICTCPAYPILLRLTNPITGSPQIVELIMNLHLPPIAPQKLHTPKQRRIVVCVRFFLGGGGAYCSHFGCGVV